MTPKEAALSALAKGRNALNDVDGIESRIAALCLNEAIEAVTAIEETKRPRRRAKTKETQA